MHRAPADVGASAGLLGRIFGQHHDTVSQGVQQASGLDPEKARKLLMMLSPVVLGMLARQQFGGQNAAQAEAGQLAGALRQEAQSARQQSPHVGGLLGQPLGLAMWLTGRRGRDQCVEPEACARSRCKCGERSA